MIAESTIEHLEIVAEPLPQEKFALEQEKEKPLAKPAAAKKLARVLDGSFMQKDIVLNWLPFIFMLVGLGMIYIANGNKANKAVFRMNSLSNELKELRSEFIISKSELMTKQKQSEVAKALSETGLKESVVPPKKITVTKNELNGKK